MTNNHIWLEPLPLKGGKSIPHRIMPGPLEGIMTPVFCRAVNELDLIDFWITPFLRITTAAPGVRFLKSKLEIYDIAKRPVFVQLLGNDPGKLADTSKRLQDLGIAGVNLNFGCPSKQVLSNNGGGKLLTNPQLMFEIIRAVCDACPDLSVSVKLRTGFSLPAEMVTFLPEMAKLNIDFIILHSRTVSEMYDDIPDGLLRISQAVPMVAPVPLIASGDVFTVEDAKKIFETSSCAGIAVARGLLRDPLLIRRIIAGLKGEKLVTDRDSKNIFFKKMCDIAIKEPGYYKRSCFLEIARCIWGEDDPKFEMLTKLADNQILHFF